MRVAIAYSGSKPLHSGSWAKAWSEYCSAYKIDWVFIDPMSTDVLKKLKDFDCFLWHFSGFSFTNMLMARSVLYSAKAMGLRIFPDFNEVWHFDDKLAESYLLDSIDASIPDYKAFYDLESVNKWAEENKEFPWVAKLRNGSGSHNVTLIKSKKEALAYSKKMFGPGINSTPSLAFKASSNIKSASSLKTIFKRLKRVPEFLQMRRKATAFPNEKGYVFFQEFVPNNGYDLKIVVVGNKLSYIVRKVRSGDFRASGGGDLFYDRSLVTKDIIESAFSVNEKLGFSCMGYDFVVDKASGKGKIVEISYGFSHTALMEAGEYLEKNGDWVKEPLNAPYEVLNNLFKEASLKK